MCYARVLYSSSLCMVVFLCCIRAHCVRLCLCIVYTVFLRLNAAAFNRQGYCSAAAFIRGRRLIEGGVY